MEDRWVFGLGVVPDLIFSRAKIYSDAAFQGWVGFGNGVESSPMPSERRNSKAL
jgi:hypothetical protein